MEAWRKIKPKLEALEIDLNQEEWKKPVEVAKYFNISKRIVYVFCYRFRNTPLVKGSKRNTYINVAILKQFNSLRDFYNRRTIELYYQIEECGWGARQKVCKYLSKQTNHSLVSWNEFFASKAFSISTHTQLSFSFSFKRKYFVDLVDGNLEKILKEKTND